AAPLRGARAPPADPEEPRRAHGPGLARPRSRPAPAVPRPPLMSATHTERAAETLTWLGHSCTAIRIDGLLIVTDPVLRGRIIHLRRKEPVDPAALDGVDLILVSHSHYDHLDLPSLDRLDRGAQVLVPAGVGGLLRRRGFR